MDRLAIYGIHPWMSRNLAAMYVLDSLVMTSAAGLVLLVRWGKSA